MSQQENVLTILLFCGEKSGDNVGGKVLKQISLSLKQKNIAFKYLGLGGESCKIQGLNSIAPLERISYNGILDTVLKLPFFLRLLKKAKTTVLSSKPSLVIFIDFPEFNKKLLALCIKNKILTYYIFPPQKWLYKKQKINSLFTKTPLLVLFPWETKFYPSSKVKQGHFFSPKKTPLKPKKPTICLCPGSRISIIKRNLIRQLKLTDHLAEEYQRVILLPSEINSIIKTQLPVYHSIEDLPLVQGAIVFPGTISLELTLKKIPIFVFAFVDPLTFFLAKKKIRYSFVSLPNLILKKKIIPEFIMWRGFKKKKQYLQEKINLFFKEKKSFPSLIHKLGNDKGDKIVAKECLSLLKKDLS